jgi:predicted house-cleaning NTP pyrophosphatase (Maf/HAM1 superfamily)
LRCGAASNAFAGKSKPTPMRIEGSYTNVMGFPTERLQATLERLGIL